MLKPSWLAAALFLVAGTADADDWRWNVGVYAFLPDISGTSRLSNVTGGDGATLHIEEILENLEFTGMVALSVKRGVWGAYTDVLYMNLGATKDDARSFTVGGAAVPANAAARVELDMEGLVWSFGGLYSLGNSDNPFDLLFGVRMLDVEQSIRWQLSGNVGSIPVASRNGDGIAVLQNWDAVVGFKGRPSFGPDSNWFMPIYGDIGTGESDFTWQVMAGLGYAFSWGDVQASWRYLDYSLESDSALQSLTFNGPQVAAIFRW